MPKYEIIDCKGKFSWLRLNDGTYIVDILHEEEFIIFWKPVY